MLSIKDFLNESVASQVNETSQIAQYNSDCQFFVNLITNVKLSEKQLTDMLSNLKKEEIDAWISYTQECYVGAEEEDEANQIRDYKGLAKFFAKYPIAV